MRSTSLPFTTTAEGLSTRVNASAGRYVVGGKLSATLQVGTTTGSVSEGFGLQAVRSPFGTFGGVLTIVALLMVVAYAESVLRVLRKGQRR